MNALVVAAAPAPHSETFYADLLTAFDLLVACDAAAEWCAALGRVPDMSVGDFDSASPDAAERLRAAGSEVLVVSARKDHSDLDLALDVALDHGATAITVTAAWRDRLDHTLAAVGCALRLPSGVSLSFVDPGLTARVLRGPVDADLSTLASPGTTLSVIALTPAEGVTLHGFEYPLVRAHLAPLSSHGLSNVAEAARVSLRAEQGTLLVMAVDPETCR